MTIATWDDRWPDRVRSLIQKLGYSDACTYIFDNPGKKFGELFRAIRDCGGAEGPSIAYVQFEDVYYRDAASSGRLRDALMESLVRVLQQYARRGWSRGAHGRRRRLTALANWPVPSEGIERWHRLTDAVWGELEAAEPPSDWCPQNRDDALIHYAFSRVWPVGVPSDQVFFPGMERMGPDRTMGTE